MSLVGVIIPGRSVITEFTLISPTQYVIEVPDPKSITDITFFLLPGSALPSGFAAVLYFSTPPFENWQLIGSVFDAKPSAILHTAFASNPEVADLPSVRFGVSIESMDNVKNLGMETSGVEERKAFAFKIAQDLYNYIASFTTNIPLNLLNQWMERFEAKYKRDPNFMMKN